MDVDFSVNWMAGWVLILLGFLSGAGIGLFFHQPQFLGGYASFERRLLRLGHIALCMLGALNVLFALSPVPGTFAGRVASVAFIAGGAAMPAVCFATAWKKAARHLFVVPVVCLLTGVILTILSGGAFR